MISKPAHSESSQSNPSNSNLPNSNQSNSNRSSPFSDHPAALDAPAAAVLASANNHTSHDGAVTLIIDAACPPPRSASRSSTRSIARSASQFLPPIDTASSALLVPPAQVYLRTSPSAPSSPSSPSPSSSSHLALASSTSPLLRATPASSPSQSITPTSSRNPLRVQTDLLGSSLHSLHSLGGTLHGTSASHDHGHSDGTTLEPTTPTTPSSSARPSASILQRRSSSSSLKPICRTPSGRGSGFHGLGGAASPASSFVASPIISAMGDVTPLPSPLLSSDSPGPWKKLVRSPPQDAQSPTFLAPSMADAALVTSNGESISAALAHMSKRKAYAELMVDSPASRPGSGSGSGSGQMDGGSGSSDHLQAPHSRQTHTRNRSLSDYTPDPMTLPKRMVTVSGMHAKPGSRANPGSALYDGHMRREPHLSEFRGLTPVEKPPTPPPSESSTDATASSTGDLKEDGKKAQPPQERRHEYFEAFGRSDGKRRRWRAVKMLGQGTFSRVMLATSQTVSLPTEAEHADDDDDDDEAEADDEDVHATARAAATSVEQGEQQQPDRRTLVAVKVCEHGPKGGASEERVEMSLKRELKIMQCIHHPSLVQLKAWNIEPTRAILILSYCPGGDLFDVASAHRAVLKPSLLARIFAEIVGAVRYLHEMRIVHRDIKLENVLVNMPIHELSDASIDWSTYPYSVTTLTDLGLSRHVADDEKLETRCGSDDYAAPEVIMGQPYDGRATDAWSLGVLLYALLEGRLPFDPTPGMSDAHRMRSRTSHRIARVEWRWIEYAGDDGDHEGDEAKFAAHHLLGAMHTTEGLLKRARSRWPLSRVAAEAWVRDAMAIPGGLRFREEEDGEEIL